IKRREAEAGLLQANLCENLGVRIVVKVIHHHGESDKPVHVSRQVKFRHRRLPHALPPCERERVPFTAPKLREIARHLSPRVLQLRRARFLRAVLPHVSGFWMSSSRHLAQLPISYAEKTG